MHSHPTRPSLVNKTIHLTNTRIMNIKFVGNHINVTVYSECYVLKLQIEIVTSWNISLIFIFISFCWSLVLFLVKMSSGSRRICLAGSSSVDAMALFRYKLFWYPTLLGLFIAKTCTFTLRLLIERFIFSSNHVS